MLTNLATHYGWWMLALILIAAEVIAPGFFMLWIGVAAAALGLITLVLPDISQLWQAVLFVVLAFISCFVYWRFIRMTLDHGSDQPLLNRRGEQMIGKRFMLETEIVNGHGKARVGDSLWMVEGPELPAGAAIEVIAIDGTTLKVKSVI